jgi:hypothetical protein
MIVQNVLVLACTISASPATLKVAFSIVRPAEDLIKPQLAAYHISLTQGVSLYISYQSPDKLPHGFNLLLAALSSSEIVH